LQAGALLVYRSTSFLPALLAGVLASIALSACTPPPPLRLAIHPWPGYAFIFMAREEGWLAPGRVSLHETRTATESLAALAEGQVDAAALTLDEVLLARARGIPLHIALVFNVSIGADKLVARPHVESLADIRGRRVGVETSALGELVFSHALAVAGLDASEVEIVPVDMDHGEAWEKLDLDALVTYEPTARQLMMAGAHSLYDSSQAPDTIFDVLAVRPEALRSRRAAVGALVEAHFRGLNALRTNPQDTAYRLAVHLDLPGDRVLGTYRGLSLPGPAGNRSYLEPGTGRLEAAARELAEWMSGRGRIPESSDLSGLTTTEFLRPEAAR